MASIVRFVDAITATPTTLLDLNTVLGPFMVSVEGIDMSPPPMRRSTVSGFLSIDGDPITATADANRTLKIPLRLIAKTSDAAATALQNLSTRLQVDGSILMIQLDGMTQPVFFRTYAAPDYVLNMLRLLITSNTEVVLEIPAEPYGYGPKQTLAQVTVFNDPARSTPVNPNPFFEVDVSDWSAGGATFVRSTAQFHEGVASGLFTPDGVTAAPQVNTTSKPATVGQYYGASAWVRCAVSRNVDIRVSWRDAGDAQLSETTATFAVTANVWKQISVAGVAPASTTQCRARVAMTGTPPAGNTLHVDEAFLYGLSTAAGGMCFDVSPVLGDVETPLFLLTVPNLSSFILTAGLRKSAMSIRRHGTPSNLQWIEQAEEADTLTNQTTLQALDATASGPTAHTATIAGGTQNFVRTDFTTTPAHNPRIVFTWPYAGAGPEVRGQYTVYARVRHATAGDTFTAALTWGRTGTQYINDTVTIPADNGTGKPNWFYINLGDIQAPPGFDPQTDGYSNTAIDAGQLTLKFHAGRLTGTGTLDVDCFLLLPIDDRSALIDWHDTDLGLSAYIIDARANAVYALDTTSRLADFGGGRPVAGSFPMLSPGVTNRIYFVRDVNSGTGSLQDITSGDDIGAYTRFTPYYWPRYRVVRPAAS